MFEVLKTLGIPVAEGEVAESQKEAVEIARRLSFPVALKIVSPDIIHKTEAGGVILNLKSEEEVKEAYRQIIRNARSFKKYVKIDGVAVQKFYQGGVETILGVIKDEVFDYTVMFGLGGVFTEVLRDVSYRIAPISQREALSMIKEIRGYPLLSGYRGESKKDIKALARAISAFSRLGEVMEVKEAEINPLLVFDKGVIAVDFRVIK